jgi:hypothetical protein
MKKLLLALGFLALWAVPTVAQVPCVGVGGVNTVPQVGLACPQEALVNSYAASGIGIAPAASATDITCIQGATNTVIRLQRLRVSGTAGTQIIVPVVLMKRASLDTGGTPATSTALPVAYPLDSANSAAKATLNAWTANPTIVDSSPGILAVENLILSKTDGTNGVALTESLFEFDAGITIEKPTLRKATEALCVNLNSTSPSSGLVNVTWVWTEASQ